MAYIPTEMPDWPVYYERWLASYNACTNRELSRLPTIKYLFDLFAQAMAERWQDKPVHILDLGIGNGELTRLLDDALASVSCDSTIDGFDMDLKALEKAALRFETKLKAHQANIFHADFSDVAPADLLLIAHTAHLCPIARPSPLQFAPPEDQIEAFLFWWQHIADACFTPETLGLLLHLAPRAGLLHEAVRRSGMHLNVAYVHHFYLDFPNLTDAQWEAIVSGKIDSLNDSKNNDPAAQTAQHLLEIALMTPLAALNPKERKGYVEEKKQQVRRANHRLARSEELAIVASKKASLVTLHHIQRFIAACLK